MLWNEKRNKKSWNFCKIYNIKTTETYCVGCKKYRSENSIVKKSAQNRLMLLSDCAVCGKKKSTFIKNKNVLLNIMKKFKDLEKQVI